MVLEVLPAVDSLNRGESDCVRDEDAKGDDGTKAVTQKRNSKRHQNHNSATVMLILMQTTKDRTANLLLQPEICYSCFRRFDAFTVSNDR
jgi:hypothetical protein